MHDKILQLAYSSFKTLGIKAVTIDFLALKLGISKKTFYQYFENKNVIVDMMVEQELEKSENKCFVSHSKSENAIDEIYYSMSFASKEIQDLNPIFIHDLEKYHRSAFDKFMSHIHTIYGETIRKNIKRGMSEGLYRHDLNVDILTKYRLQSLFMVFDQNVFPKEQYNLLEVTKTILENFLIGISTEKGMKSILQYKEKYNHTI